MESTLATQDGKDWYAGGWIQTYLGGRFFILDPREEDINIRDIAHALSQLCRFTGHTSRFYSVAEHSVKVSQIVPPEDALWGLLHDAPEAYINDLNRPLKHTTDVGEAFRKVEDKIMEVIARKFGLADHAPQSIKKADTAMLYREKEKLLPPLSWDGKWNDADKTPAKVDIIGYSPIWAEEIFLARFRELASNELVELLAK